MSWDLMGVNGILTGEAAATDETARSSGHAGAMARRTGLRTAVQTLEKCLIFQTVTVMRGESLAMDWAPIRLLLAWHISVGIEP